MIFNFFILLGIYIYLFSLGILFKKKILFEEDRDFSFFETIFFGVFLLSFIALVANFFIALHNYFFLTFLCILFIFCFFLFSKEILLKIKSFLLLSLLFCPLSLSLNFGYDAGLYHIPFQTVIQNENISFGLANLHARYGLTTSFSYVASLLWFKDFFNILACFSTVLFSLFFVFIYEKLKTRNIIDYIFSLSALLSLPLWYRYAPLHISLVDIFFSIFFYFTIYYGVKVLFDLNQFNIKFKKKLFLLIIFLSYTISTKPTAVFLIVYLFFIVIYKYRIIFSNIYEILKSNYLSILFSFCWVLKNIIISACLFYPVKLSCLNLEWKTSDVSDMVLTIQNWNSLIFNSFIKILLSHKFELTIIISLILLVFLNLKNLYSLILKQKKILFVVFLTLLAILSQLFQPLDLIAHKIQTYQNTILKSIYFTELFLIFSFYVLSIIVLTISFKDKIIFIKLKNIRYKNIIPLLFFCINFYIWIISTPNPRLGQNLFIVVLPVIAIFILDIDKFKLENNFKYLKIFIIFVILQISVIQTYDKLNLNNIVFFKQIVPTTKLIERKSYGYMPGNSENLCWSQKQCHPYGDVIVYKRYMNYKFFKEVKN